MFKKDLSKFTEDSISIPDDAVKAKVISANALISLAEEKRRRRWVEWQTPSERATRKRPSSGPSSRSGGSCSNTDVSSSSEQAETPLRDRPSRKREPPKRLDAGEPGAPLNAVSPSAAQQQTRARARGAPKTPKANPAAEEVPSPEEEVEEVTSASAGRGNRQQQRPQQQQQQQQQQRKLQQQYEQQQKEQQKLLQ